MWLQGGPGRPQNHEDGRRGSLPTAGRGDGRAAEDGQGVAVESVGSQQGVADWLTLVGKLRSPRTQPGLGARGSRHRDRNALS